MRQLCYRIVIAFSDWWIWIGWAGFVASLVSGLWNPLLFLGVTLLWFVWWTIDAVNEEVRWWQVLAGITLLVLSPFAPLGFFLVIACWVIYCFRVRE